MRIPKPVTGMFPNTMAYARWGDGPKSLLVVPGGPGNDAPTTQSVKMMGGSLRPLVEDGYTLLLVTRRRGMPQGHTIDDMASDYADLIATEFGGRVDLVVGISTGGLIGQSLAVAHPDRFDHIALVATAYTFSQQGLRLDYDWATARSQGESAKGGRLMAEAMLSDSWLRWTAPALGTLIGLLFRSEHDQFASDVMVEAEAQMNFDARPALPGLTVPVLLVGGDKDYYMPVSMIEETARLIPDCTLKIYQGKGHMGTVRNRQLAPDILDFIHSKESATT